MTTSSAFIIGDIHGQYDMLVELLNSWDSATQQLIFLGDIIDRGPQSLPSIQLVRRYQREYGAICLMGNHEQMLLETLREPEHYFPRYKRNGGLTTISELLNCSVEELDSQSGVILAQRLRDTHNWLEPWLASLPYYVEFGTFVAVHAGVDLQIPNWHHSTPRDFVWIREPFHQTPNKTGNTFIFGHTPVQNLNQNANDHHVWHEVGKIGIDGGAAYGGPLYGIVVSKTKVLDLHKVSPTQ